MREPPGQLLTTTDGRAGRTERWRGGNRRAAATRLVALQRSGSRTDAKEKVTPYVRGVDNSCPEAGPTYEICVPVVATLNLR